MSPVSKTRARRDGEDWVIDGSKMFITNAVYGDLLIVAARTDPDAKGSRGISLFIVERNTPGVSATKLEARLALFGYRGADVRFRPRAEGGAARRGQPRLLRHHGNVPERAHLHRRHLRRRERQGRLN